MSTRDTRDVLARTIWGEARGERPVRQAMAAVASVILNRAHNPRWWGRNIYDVCKKPWQFSVWNPDSTQLKLLLAVGESDPQFRTALKVAEEAIAGTLKDETNYADHYHHHQVSPLWSRGRKPVASIGNHRFFRIELSVPKGLKNHPNVRAAVAEILDQADD